MAAHAYWRFAFLASASGAVTVAELQMRTTAGGGTVTTGGTAGGTNVSGSYPASQAFDGNTATLCVSTALPETVSYHFASAVDIVEYAVIGRSDGFYTDGPTTWYFDYSDDGTTWHTVDTVAGQTSWTSGQTRVFTVGANTGSYVPQSLGAIGQDLKSEQPATAGSTPVGNGGRLAGMRSAGPATTVSGTISVAGTGTAGLIVRAYDKTSGAMVGQATSGGGGAYSINCGGFTDVYVAAFDPTTYQAVIYDEVVPG